MQRRVAIVVAPGAGQTIEGPAGGPLTFKVRGEQTDGALTAFENVIAPGTRCGSDSGTSGGVSRPTLVGEGSRPA